MNALNRIILKTAFWGTVWTLVVFCYTTGIVAMSFPRSMADFFDSTGNQSLSLVYTERVYTRNPTPENLYLALFKSIECENNPKIIYYGDKFFSLEDSVKDELIKKADEYIVRNAKEAGAGVTELQTAYIAANTDNTLRRRFIRALLNCGGEVNSEKADAALYAALNVDTKESLFRPSYAILEFPSTAVVQGAAFLKYYSDYKKLYEATALSDEEKYKVQFFVDNAMYLYTEVFE